MNEMRLASRIPNRLRRIVLAGLLAWFTMASGVTSALGDDNTRPTSQPAASLDPQTLFAQASPAVVKIRTYSKTKRPLATGSGFLIDAAGTIVTNHHIIKDAASVRVYIQKRSWLTVTKTIGVDKSADLAVVKVDGKDLPFLKLREALPKAGRKVYAIGCPRGLTNKLNDALVSGLRRDPGMTLIRISAPISYGSSGGPLLSSDGAVVGVTTSSFSRKRAPGFAVPVERVLRLIKKPTLPPRGTSGPLKSPYAKAENNSKIYESLAPLLSEMPRDIIPTDGKPFSDRQRSRFTKWIAKNVAPGTVVGFTGECARSSGAKSDTVTLRFKRSVLPIHGRNGYLWVAARFDARLAENFLKSKAGKTLTIHGQILSLKDYTWYPHYWNLTLTLSNCASGKAPLPRKAPGKTPKTAPEKTPKKTPEKTAEKTPEKPKPASRPAKPKRTNEGKARSQLGLAKSYIDSGLKTKAVKVLKAIVAKYPKTSAAADAKAELRKLD